MSRNRGLPKLAGGIAKREREAWQKPCAMRGCNRPAAGVIETLSGPRPICAEHTPGARQLGYVVRTDQPTARRFDDELRQHCR